MIRSKSNAGRPIIGLVIVVITAMLGFGFFVLPDADLFLKINRGIDVFGKVYKEIALNYVDDVDPERFMRAGIDGMLKTLDPYTNYLDERESDEIDLVTTGKYGGIGVTIGLRDGMITVVNLIEGFSAAKQGIQTGDRIVEIDGKEVKGATLEQVRNMVRGAPGTEVRVKIEREGEVQPIEFVLVREEISVRNVSYTGYVDQGIGYVRLERFSRTAGDDVRNALKDLRSRGQLKALILDLRDNPGGLLDIAVDVAEKFLPESSLVVSTRGRRPDSERKYFSDEKPMAPDLPLAVLVNRNSASASEIVAGAIQDLDRGIIVGTRTFGKGLVQTISRISESSSLKITTARYYTPSGRCIQELDYTHRTTSGAVVPIPDSLRKEYRTSHNRKVYEAGGILPDTTVEEPPPSRFVEELLRKAMFFKYANRFAAQKKVIPDKFVVTDEILKDFEAFLKEKNFEYQEETEVKLTELRELASKGRYAKEFHEGVEKLSGLVKQEKARVFERYKKEVKSLLAMEILGRVKGEKQRIEASFADDTQLAVAVNLVKSRVKYEQILSGKMK
ncbi:MAG TPA: S41 family peptidase [Bacteroidota bacterium]|nr:S41 family peptidase [Bacteroidota bacterium]